jgi:outer membrane cobalamin receptor
MRMLDLPPEPRSSSPLARARGRKPKTPASVTLIDAERIERIGRRWSRPAAAGAVVAVRPARPAGSLTEVRIRGAEANHTLLFVDGIRANDPAAGNAPRFELLNADLASRIEVVRGPQSALWGSEAIGGVVAVDGVNRTRGTRRSLEAQLERRFATGASTHRLIVAADDERETFHARDVGLRRLHRPGPGRAPGADRRVARHDRFTGDVAVRRDIFNRFKDATSLRASRSPTVGGGFSLAGSYAEGIAQPTFFDLYGFFPGNFVGNPSLKPESSRGFEASLRFRRGPVRRIADRLSPAPARRWKAITSPRMGCG